MEPRFPSDASLSLDRVQFHLTCRSLLARRKPQLPGQNPFLIAIILCVGAMLQGVVGFGFGLLSIPLLMWLGVSLPHAIAIVIPLVFFQTGFNCLRRRDDIPWRSTIEMSTVRALSLPLGVWLLSKIANFDVARAKQVVGIFLLLTVLSIWLFRPTPKDRLARSWTVIAGILSGICAGMVGMGGPPITVWVLSHSWPAARQRAFLWSTIMLLAPVQLILMWFKFGDSIRETVVMAILMIPPVLVSAWLGGKAGDRLDRTRLRNVAMVALLLIAIRNIAAPWF